MALLYPSTGVADPIKFGNSLLALDVAASTVLGMGVITGLLVSGAGLVATGDALIGHVVTLGTAFNAAPLLIASSTNYVYLQMPATPICPDRTGKDPGVVVVTTSATPPANAVLLATITTGAASAITAVNTAPSARRNLTLPLALLDLRSVGPYNAGTTYQVGNIVGYSGGGYIAKIVSTGVTPVEGTSWGLVASAGATGPTGPTGAAGTATLAADTDVQLTSIADADLLTWSAAASKWVNRALALLGLTNSVPSAETSGAAGSAGTASTAARADHVHAMPTAFPPSAHAASHAVAGSDALSATSIGALAASNNLSDLVSASAARTSLALGTAAITNIPASGNASASQVVLGNDTRLTSTGVSLSGVNPPAETVGAAAAVGSAATAARADHSHAMPGVFGVSGAGHSAGFVPDPGATAGTVNFLREDGTWVTPAGGGLSVTESIGNGADLALSTAYQTIATISVSVAANAATDANALVEVVADATTGNDDLYVQLYDTIAAAAIQYSERHVSHIAAGKRGQILLSKYVPGIAGGRTLVLQAKNATAARGTVNTNRSLLQVLGVSSGTSSGGGISSPTQVAGLTLWLNAGAITGIADGAAVATWPDSSGGGHSAAQATGTLQPIYKASLVNGKPGVRFDGSSQFMTLGNLSSFFPSAASLFIVATYGAFQYQCIYTTNSTLQDFWYFTNNGGGYYSVFKVNRTASYPTTFGLASSGTHLYSTISSASSWQMFYDQVGKDILAGDFSGGVNHVLGKNSDGSAYLNGDILEVIAYNSALSTSDRQNVEGYLKAKYGI